ncbi:hypothetical protein ON010_g8595 [Phytophthora cinnamomi]|nr:hypothetical protein ON010_g8595 [Phytophthora cinnamomi]
MDSTAGVPGKRRPGYGLLANDVAALLKGCPSLAELEIAIDQEKNEAASEPLLDADVFGDKFWEAVVERCPLLQSVYVHDCSSYGGNRSVRPIRTFTDCALLALADQPRLASIELSPVCCSGNGVIENKSELGVASCDHKISLNVFNPHSSSVDKEWSISYVRDELKPLLEKVADAHPLLDLHIVLCRDNEESFRRIDNIELDWGPGFQDGDVFIEDEYVGHADSDGGGSDEDGEEFDDGPIDHHDLFLRRHAMFMDDFEVVSDDEENDGANP